MNQGPIAKKKYINTPNLRHTSRQKSATPLVSTTVEKSQTVDEYSIRQQMKVTQDQAQATSYGFYISVPSRYNNFIIPSIPRINAAHHKM
ncbi:hypothetical protein BCR42DRAFT_423672 [Absidia repens]|uniref:Uncharacterized protein n=1 Tax=Absidia repens TaxID=90262 RepID=A0A1X2I536_9FUNG|nr:hypothetical protein BCR42DRAFT_423672 [Absidia repens]